MSEIKDREQRLKICNECEHLAFGICRVCYCYVSIKASAERFKCPKGKW